MEKSKDCAVVLHGGMGNQLFQWAYGHSLEKKGLKVNFVFYDKPYSLNHASESLATLIGTCKHGEFLRVGLSKYKIIRLIQDPTHPKNPKSKFDKKLINTLNQPFDIPLGTRSAEIYFGYYQSAAMVLQIADALIPEIVESLENREVTQLEKQLVGSEVVHIRQGDTMTPKNIQRVGVLNSTYYHNLPRKESALRIVVTDDVLGAKAILVNQDIDAFYGPGELDTKSSLRVMSRSSKLFTANSTLSWWGGLLAQSNGGSVYIPEPFFRNVIPSPGDAFQFPGFKYLPSSFLALESK
jgi:hypothetical protein